jgi:hypothetical protein
LYLVEPDNKTGNGMLFDTGYGIYSGIVTLKSHTFLWYMYR